MTQKNIAIFIASKTLTSENIPAIEAELIAIRDGIGGALVKIFTWLKPNPGEGKVDAYEIQQRIFGDKLMPTLHQDQPAGTTGDDNWRHASMIETIVAENVADCFLIGDRTWSKTQIEYDLLKQAWYIEQISPKLWTDDIPVAHLVSGVQQA